MSDLQWMNEILAKLFEDVEDRNLDFLRFRIIQAQLDIHERMAADRLRREAEERYARIMMDETDPLLWGRPRDY